MAFLISGNLAIDETSGTQNQLDGGSDTTGNDVAGGLSTLVSNAPEFDALLAVVVGTGVEPTGVSVSNATADNSTGSSLLTGLGADVTDLAFTDAAGNPLDGDVAKFGAGAEDFLRTADGSKIYLYGYTGDDLPGVDENNVVFGRKANADGSANAAGDIVFAAYLQPTGTADATLSSDAGALGAKVWLVEYEAIQHGTAGATAAAHDDARFLTDPLYVTVSNQTDFSLEGAPSGQNLFLMYGDGTPSADDVAIVVTGKNPADQSDGYSITTGDTVNTGKGGGGTTIGSNNQMIDPSEGMFFTFVKGANTGYTVPNLSQNEADVEANIAFTSMYEATAATFNVVQLQPPKEATLKLTAYTTEKETGTDFIDGLHDDVMGDIDYVKVTTFTRKGVPTENVFEDSGTDTQTLNGIDVTFNADGSVTIAGVTTNSRIEYHTEGTHNRVLIDNVGGDSHHSAAFDIGGFALVNSNTDTDAFAALAFQDDGPSVTVSATSEESVLLTTQDAQTDGDPTDSDTAVTTADFSGVFGNTPAYGADGDGGTVMSYALDLYGADGGASGLASNGAGINLFDVDGTIVGSTASALADVAVANTIFSIAVAAATGVVTLTQYAEIDHALESETGSPFDDQLATLATGLVKLTGTAVSTDGDGDTASDDEVVDLGGNIRFADDGPTLSGVDDSTNSIVFGLPISPATWSAHDDFTFATGADGLGGMAVVDFTDPDDAADLAASGLDHLEALLGVDITAAQSGDTVTYYTPDGSDADTDPDGLFQFVLTDSDWTFTILQDAPLVFNDFNFGILSAGGPQEILSLAATNSTTYGVFDGFLFGAIDAADGTEARGISPPTPINLPGSTTADRADDLNPDAHGFGVKGGAASNMNNNEGFSVSFHEGSATGDDKMVEGLRFAMDQQGNTDDVVLSFRLTDSGTMPDIVAIEEGSTINLIESKDLATVDGGSFWLRMGLPGGNNDVLFTILNNEYKDVYAPQANELVIYVDGGYETATFRMAYPETGTYDQYPGQVGDSVRVKDVTLIEKLPIPNLALEFSVQGTDGDGDTTQAELVGVMVSEDGAPFVYPFA